jgi:hydrogenase 3 maturation protease
MKGTSKGSAFEKIFEGKTVIVGVGNILRGDDGLGPHLVERLKEKLDVTCINAESSLDRYVGPIARERPDSVLLIDAVHLDAKPGSYEVMEPDQIIDTKTSTHDLSPKDVMGQLRRRIDGKVYLLGVQPASVKLGDGISRKIKRTVRYLERRIVKTVKSRVLEQER